MSASTTRRGFLLGAGATGAVAVLRRPARAARGLADIEAALPGMLAKTAAVSASLAIMIDGQFAGALANGRTRADSDGRPVSPETLYQAASVSKSIAAVTGLRLAEAGTVSLDEDVTAYLKSWSLPPLPAGSSQPVTLRRLFGMTSGANVPGFAGYRHEQPLPDLVAILDGAPPANSEPVAIIHPPGIVEAYSGGGYQIAQQVIADVTGQPFEAMARSEVLEPVGMARSTFAQPLPEMDRNDAAAGHLPGGTVMEGGCNVFPELAAAGLWSTPGDLVRFMAAVVPPRPGKDGLLSQSGFETMMTPVDGFGYGIGVIPMGTGAGRSFAKSGHNIGYRSYILAYPEIGAGVAIMTNSDTGDRLIPMLIDQVISVFGWPPVGSLPEL